MRTHEKRKQWLLLQLANGPVPSREITAQAERDNISVRMLRETARKMGVEFYKDPSEFNGIWYWELPDGYPPGGVDVSDELEEVPPIFVNGRPLELAKTYQIKSTGELITGAQYIDRLRNK